MRPHRVPPLQGAPAPASPSPHEQMADYMNRLDFVSWDRQIPRSPSNQEIVFGWIDRPGSGSGGRSDFVVLMFDVREGDDVVCGCFTSSEEYAEEIGRRLHGTPARVHCERIEDVYGELVHRTVERKPMAAWRSAA